VNVDRSALHLYQFLLILSRRLHGIPLKIVGATTSAAALFHVGELIEFSQS